MPGGVTVSTSLTLLLLSLMPFALLVVVLDTIVILALCQTKPEGAGAPNEGAGDGHESTAGPGVPETVARC
ncbi:hypothetical protein JOF29_007723 [Kribbella aluminosa]|uniref:Uncharacterized protein n=1 Tax=Kribbella aluminosa TaxID=416017 RepID=A0ABS4UY70_9ACTN|nr:hypothetical protein [Kribbella aluminosa]